MSCPPSSRSCPPSLPERPVANPRPFPPLSQPALTPHPGLWIISLPSQTLHPILPLNTSETCFRNLLTVLGARTRESKIASGRCPRAAPGMDRAIPFTSRARSRPAGVGAGRALGASFAFRAAPPRPAAAGPAAADGFGRRRRRGGRRDTRRTARSTYSAASRAARNGSPAAATRLAHTRDGCGGARRAARGARRPRIVARRPCARETDLWMKRLFAALGTREREGLLGTSPEVPSIHWHGRACVRVTFVACLRAPGTRRSKHRKASLTGS